MKVLVIGATGATGQLAVEKLLAKGHEVTAFARRPEAVTAKHEKLRIAKGDARDAASLDAAVQGQDAVFVAFGPRSLKKDDVQEVLMRHLVAAMRKHGVKRMVNLSAWGAGESAPHIKFLFSLARKTILKNVFDDKERGEVLLRASGLDYVNVCPGQLLNAPARAPLKASLDGRGIKPQATRADLADFMIDQLTGDAWLRKSVIVGY